jgi:hypothetical protein
MFLQLIRVHRINGVAVKIEEILILGWDLVEFVEGARSAGL